MVRSTLILALATSLSLVAACSDIAAPRRNGSDDGQQTGELRGKRNDPQPHPDLVSFSREAQPGDIRDAEARQEAEHRREAEARREREQRQEPQPGDDRRGRGADDSAKHG